MAIFQQSRCREGNIIERWLARRAFGVKVEKDQSALAEYLERLAAHVRNGTIHAVFAVVISDDGPRQVVLVDREQREPLMIAINEELTSMLGAPHHVVSTEKLANFLAAHKITPVDLLAFNEKSEY